MFKNYLKIALRTLQRQKLYSAINIFSLSIGIACCMLILLYVRHEWSFDRFHDNAERIYRVYRVEERANGQTKVSEGTPTPLGPALAAEMPGVEGMVRLRTGDALIQHDDEAFSHNVLFADPGFFETFTFPLQAGSAAGALQTPGNIILSADLATTFFGEDDPVGQTLSIQLADALEVFTISGVAAPFLPTSTIRFDALVPLTQWADFADVADDWSSFNNATYLLLAEGTDSKTVQQQLDRLVPQYFGEQIEESQASGWWRSGDDAFRLHLQPLSDIHLNPEVTNFFFAASDPRYSYILGGIALLVLLLACVNFTTLAAGRAAGRAREVGVRKTLGAHRLQLIKQFWGEALLLSAFALVIGLVLVELLLPIFNTLADTSLTLSYAESLLVLLGLSVLTVLSGLVAGSYPALILSGYRPAQVLKGKIAVNKGTPFTRVLVVFQFTISIVLIAATLGMFTQLDFVKTKNLGFADEEIVTVALNASDTDATTTLERLKQHVAGFNGIQNVSSTTYAFGPGWARTVITHEDRHVIIYLTGIDPQYLETMDLALVEGRNFSADLETDREGAVLINETFARELGWTDPVGRLLPGYDDVTIIGVVEDFHFQSLHDTIQPVVLHMSTLLGAPTHALVRIRTDRVAETIAFLGDQWAQIAPGLPFDYEFLDQRLDQLYQADQRWSRIIQYAALLAILIACLGLFGLASLTAARRTKELGVRKVLGASTTSITMLLAKDFAQLVLIAFVIGTPVAYLLMNRWLNTFAYRVDLSLWIFLGAGLAALGVALLTVSYQSVRAALANPVDSLRYE